MMGGGVCWIDADNDGWLDLFAVNSYADDDLGYWLAPRARGRGVTTRAVLLLSRWAFDSLPVERIEITIEPETTKYARPAENDCTSRSRRLLMAAYPYTTP